MPPSAPSPQKDRKSRKEIRHVNKSQMGSFAIFYVKKSDRGKGIWKSISLRNMQQNYLD